MKFTTEGALKFTKISVALLASWPPSINASKIKLFLIDLYFVISFIFSQTYILQLFYGVYVYKDNLEVMIQTASMAIAIIQMSIKLFVCRLQRSNFQSVTVEMEDFLKQAKPHEKDIIEKYINRCGMFHTTLTFGFYMAATNIVLGPIFLPQPLPTLAVYPFNVESHPLYEFIYLTQAIIALQASSAAAVDCQVAILVWFASARFEMLQIEISHILNEYDLKWCIIKHRQILSYAENVVKTVRFVILATIGITTILIVFSGLLLFFTDSITIKFQFFVLDIVAIIQLFVNSYPAEHLIEMSSAIGSAAYNLNWFDNSQTVGKNLLVLIQRSQKPVTINISGFVPTLSLAYYMSFLSSTFSYFTTMRAAVN